MTETRCDACKEVIRPAPGDDFVCIIGATSERITVCGPCKSKIEGQNAAGMSLAKIIKSVMVASWKDTVAE